MQRVAIIATALAGGALAIGQPAAAQNWSWQTIADLRVGVGTDIDQVTVRSYNRYRSLRLCSVGAPIHVRDIKIRFVGGDAQQVPFDAVIAAGSCSAAIDLKGDERNVNKVRLRFQPSARTGGQPVVRIQAI